MQVGDSRIGATVGSKDTPGTSGVTLPNDVATVTGPDPEIDRSSCTHAVSGPEVRIVGVEALGRPICTTPY